MCDELRTPELPGVCAGQSVDDLDTPGALDRREVAGAVGRQLLGVDVVVRSALDDGGDGATEPFVGDTDDRDIRYSGMLEKCQLDLAW